MKHWYCYRKKSFGRTITSDCNKCRWRRFSCDSKSKRRNRSVWLPEAVITDEKEETPAMPMGGAPGMGGMGGMM
jgi:hypothetical protein